MGLTADFDDRQVHVEAAAEEYHPYAYQTEGNGSWAGALPVKQYVVRPPAVRGATHRPELAADDSTQGAVRP